MKLRMGFDHVAARQRIARGAFFAECLPLRLGHAKVERWQDHHTLVHPCDGSEKSSGSRCRQIDSGRADKMGCWAIPPPPGQRFQQAVAAIGKIYRAPRPKQLWPVIKNELELIERALPVDRQIGDLRSECPQARGLDLFEEELIQRLGQFHRQTKGLGCIDFAVLLNQSRKHHETLGRVHRWRNR